MKFSVGSEEDTARLAQAFAGGIESGISIGLSGDLGAGKTTFVRYLVGALGGNVSAVSSPSFTLEHEYPVANMRVIDHWDLYRITDLPDELFEPPAQNVIQLIEWPERCPDISGRLDLIVRFDVAESGARIVSLEGPEAVKVATFVHGRYG
jgi:tRNA threonylcarbamoyladenosine biosynthesis protein TsaE